MTLNIVYSDWFSLINNIIDLKKKQVFVCYYIKYIFKLFEKDFGCIVKTGFE